MSYSNYCFYYSQCFWPILKCPTKLLDIPNDKLLVHWVLYANKFELFVTWAFWSTISGNEMMKINELILWKLISILMKSLNEWIFHNATWIELNTLFLSSIFNSVDVFIEMSIELNLTSIQIKLNCFHNLVELNQIMKRYMLIFLFIFL